MATVTSTSQNLKEINLNTTFFSENNILVLPNIMVHKFGWNGVVCPDAALYNQCCETNSKFRHDFCAKGIPVCNHLNIFNSSNPFLKVKVSQLPHAHIDTLNLAFGDQILVFTSYAPLDYDVLHEVKVIRPYTTIGFYRIKEITEDSNSRDVYVIRPYEDGWVRFPKLVSHYHYWTRLDERMANINSLASHHLKDDLYYMDGNKNKVDYHDPQDKFRVENGLNKIDEWINAANKRIPLANQALSQELNYREIKTINNPFKDIILRKNVVIQKEIIPKEVIKTVPLWQIAISHLSDKLQAQFCLAWRSKPLIILSGEPGSGKSQIARNLVKPEHRCIISVSSAFTSQEDLLGYYNPVNTKFHGFILTTFLIECEKAWLSGDKTDRVVVLEEMNIAQPEHYMSDILAKTQYQEDVDARAIHFSAEIEGYPGKSSVFLSPAIKFIGTVNTDHSVRKLTQRILDRSSIIKIEITPSTILKHVGLEDIQNTLTECIADLNMVLDGRYRFSYRTGMSLRIAIDMIKETEDESVAFKAFDLVLIQEVWPRVSSSFQSDFNAEKILGNLNRWIGEYGEQLVHSALILDDWNIRMSQGINIDTLGL